MKLKILVLALLSMFMVNSQFSNSQAKERVESNLNLLGRSYSNVEIKNKSKYEKNYSYVSNDKSCGKTHYFVNGLLSIKKEGGSYYASINTNTEVEKAYDTHTYKDNTKRIYSKNGNLIETIYYFEGTNNIKSKTTFRDAEFSSDDWYTDLFQCNGISLFSNVITETHYYKSGKVRLIADGSSNSIKGFSPNSEEVYHIKSDKTGYVEDYDDNGIFESKGSLVDDEKSGLWEELVDIDEFEAFNKTILITFIGKKKLKRNLKAGNKLVRKANYLDGKMNGNLKFFYDTGEPYGSYQYAGYKEFTGPVKIYYKDGSIFFDGVYKKVNFDGFENTALIIEKLSYEFLSKKTIKGQLVETYSTFAKYGNWIETISYGDRDKIYIHQKKYKDNKPVGEHLFSEKIANTEYLIDRIIYDDYGDKVYETNYYSESNQVRYTIEYLKNKIFKQIFYFENGIKNLELIRASIDGKMYTKKVLNQNKEDGTALVKNGIGTYYSFDGSVLVQTHELKDGYVNGRATKYFDNGQISSEILYKSNGEVWFWGSPWEVLDSFDEDGNSREKGTLNNGNGTIIIYDKNGSIDEVRNYKNGERIK